MAELKIGVVGPTFPPIEGISRISQRLEEKGYDSIWFPDHLMGWFPHTIWDQEHVGRLAESSPHTFFETTLSMAIAAISTKRLRIGSAVTEPIRHHPAMLAQSYATLEHIAPNRIVLGIGAGEAENVVPYGLKFEKIVTRLEEAIKIIRLLWNSNRDELVNFEGKIFKLNKAVFELPPKNSRPPIWIGGAGERICRITARLADGWIPFGIDVDEYKKKVELIKEECTKIKRDSNEIEFALYHNIIVDKNRDECHRLMNTPIIKAAALIAPYQLYEKHGYSHPLGEKFYPLTDYIPAWYSREEILKAIEKVPKEVVEDYFIWGTVEDVIEKLDKYRKVGAQTVVLWNFTFFPDSSKVKSSYSCIDEIVEYYKS